MTHYATLGVADTATPEEVKSAYRKLAKQHHPDLGGDVAKFQQISEAYETLADVNKRSHYDHQLRNPQPQFNQGFPGGFQFHHNFGDDAFRDINDQFSQMFGFPFSQARQAPRNRNVRIQLSINFLETLDTCQKTIEYNLSSGSERITLDLPAGIADQTILQMAGRGDNAIPSVPRGTLEIVVRVIPHAKFTRVDDHIMSEVTIDCFQAITGHEIEMETPRGRTIRLSIPAGTQSGTQFGITDEGFIRSNRTIGKLIVKVNVMIPTALTKEQINLVQQIQLIKPVNT
jgi:curved DNA-binding protein